MPVQIIVNRSATGFPAEPLFSILESTQPQLPFLLIGVTAFVIIIIIIAVLKYLDYI